MFHGVDTKELYLTSRHHACIPCS